MGRSPEKDFAEMSARLRGRAAQLIGQLDAGGYGRKELRGASVRIPVGRTLSGPGLAEAKSPALN
jgi:hypothetical protein